MCCEESKNTALLIETHSGYHIRIRTVGSIMLGRIQRRWSRHGKNERGAHGRSIVLLRATEALGGTQIKRQRIELPKVEGIGSRSATPGAELIGGSSSPSQSRVSRHNLTGTVHYSLRRSRKLLKQLAISDATADATADAAFALGEDDTLTCGVATDSQFPCYRPVIDLRVLVKGNGNFFEIVREISETLGGNSGATDLIEKLDLIDVGYASILNMFIGDLDETDSEPSRSPSSMPFQIQVISYRLILLLDYRLNQEPSRKPSNVLSQVPTKPPTVPATRSPTLSPVVGCVVLLHYRMPW